MTKHTYNCLFLVLGIGIGYYLHQGWWYYLGVILLFVGILSWGVFDIRLSYFIPTIYHLKDRKVKQVVLTFDDGPTELTPQFLDLLKRYEAKAVFFCIGHQVEKHPQILQRIKEEGHLIGNHTYSHIPQNCFVSTTTMICEIQRVDNPHIAKAARQTKKKVVGWDIRSLDTVIKDEERLFKRIVSKFSQGNIILMHDTSERTLRVLERLLQYLQDHHYKIVNQIE